MQIEQILARTANWPELRRCLAAMPPALAATASEQRYDAGALLQQKGDEVDRLGLLCRGSLRVVNPFDTGDSYVIEQDDAVDFVGDVVLLAGERRAPISLQAVTDCLILWFERAAFARWVQGDPALLRLMAGHIAGKLYRSSYRHGQPLFYPGPRLLADFLSRYADQNRPGDDGRYRVTDTRQQLAQLLGLSQKTVDRAVAQLKKQQLIDTDRGKIVFSDRQAAGLRELGS